MNPVGAPLRTRPRHSQAPWECISDDYLIEDAFGYGVAEVVWEADAELMVQAPAMLQALLSFEALLPHLEPTTFPGTPLLAWYANQVVPVLNDLCPQQKLESDL